MSIAAIAWAWGVEGLTPVEKLVLLAYADFVDEHGKCWPTITTVTAKVGASRRAVFKARGHLAQLGLLSPSGRLTYLTVGELSAPTVGAPIAPTGAPSAPKGAPSAPPSEPSITTNEPVPAEEGKGEHHAAMFAVLCEAMGRQPAGGEGAAWGRVAKMLAGINAVPADVGMRAARYRKRWPNVELTPTALWMHWGEFAGLGPLAAGVVALDPCPECGGYVTHREWCLRESQVSEG